MRSTISALSGTGILVLAAAGIALSLVSCSDGRADLIAVTPENKYITANDLLAGVKKTSQTMTAVMFSHRGHETAGVACETCHHKSFNDERIKQCMFCHKGLQGTQKMHDFCIGCHAAKKSGPERCNGCHLPKKASEMRKALSTQFNMSGVYGKSYHPKHREAGVACATCHHRDSDEKYRKCSFCHEGDSRMKVLHFFCGECHKKNNRGPRECNGCHTSFTGLKVADYITLPDTGHRKPPIRFSHRAHIVKYNTECTDCHHRGTDYKCSGCHLVRDQGNVVNLKEAFHQQCQDCHRRTSGPRSCGGCHR